MGLVTDVMEIEQTVLRWRKTMNSLVQFRQNTLRETDLKKFKVDYCVQFLS